ncbi:Metal-dependent hydrolase, endonuclease/exonuclease/phosphatase family [Amycolatopsis arida]|uniref:Metal-dependent hydrolase, endonuclease/exonuclease/phosphatase family n=1 Tax=Amycolatopsis arida TaxID=587909 RepID=A0A1I5Z5N6_9PSEU|nr:endonuclease/exonuclease/phosphatase family protein [Amycolatopsis arida]TDX90161.1 endonuclease/exonuclease/phosphatase family metal-dependent hydrolase [Amycolatopsis arida]SFQ51760.1 Metal-dependent hydrolase, endonuclease/exonuclease/phosphatase family [Amycolatopsis arida]
MAEEKAGITRRGMLGAVGAAGMAGLLGTGTGTASAGHRDALIGRAGGDTLHVVSFNIRYDAGAAPGTPDSWTDRRPVLARFLEIEQPTALGVQEALYHQVKEVAADLPRYYDWIGLGREGGGRGEFMAVYYDTRRLEPRDFDHFWLSDTPALIGSTSWGNTVVRMVTWVRFRDRRTSREFVHLNTHFDHRSENSRQRSAELVLDRVRGVEEGLSVLVTGDFNTPAGDSESYRVLVTDGGLVDTWTAAARRLTPAWGTFPNYRDPVLDGPRIDWVLGDDRVEVLRAAINPFRVDGRYPSDHVPVQALVRLH